MARARRAKCIRRSWILSFCRNKIKMHLAKPLLKRDSLWGYIVRWYFMSLHNYYWSQLPHFLLFGFKLKEYNLSIDLLPRMHGICKLEPVSGRQRMRLGIRILPGTLVQLSLHELCAGQSLTVFSVPRDYTSDFNERRLCFSYIFELKYDAWMASWIVGTKIIFQ